MADRMKSNNIWSQTPPQEGLSLIDVEAQDIENIPGVALHWGEEIKKRKQEILEWDHGSFLKKTFTSLGSNKGVSGEDIAKYTPVPPVFKLVKILKKNPLNYRSRVQLVSLVSKGRDLPIEAYRALLLQITVAHTLGKFSIQGLQVAISVQTAYFRHLQAKCRHEIRLQRLRKEKALRRGVVIEGMKNNWKKINPLIHRNINILSNYR